MRCAKCHKEFKDDDKIFALSLKRYGDVAIQREFICARCHHKLRDWLYQEGSEQ